MADPRFKVRRQAYFGRGITGASTITVSGSAVIGSGGTAIAGLLAGSGEVTFGAVAASVASATCFVVTGLTVAHKIFLTAACLSACATPACVYSNPAAPTELVVGINNNTSEALGAGTSTVFYLAVLDK